MSPINIFTLPPVTRDISGEESSLQQQKQIEAGLLGSKELTVPGSTHEDQEWAFKRSVPTVVLYDEQGLR